MSEQLVFDLPQRVALERDMFLVADSNAEAVALIDDFAQWQQPVQWLYGPSGCGKTHLAAVLANQANAVMPAPDNLQNDPHLAAVMAGDSAAQIVILDGLDRLTETGEEALFHLINQARHGGVPVLLLSQNPASRLAVTLPDLQSRLKAIPAIAVTMPDDTLVAGLIGKLFADRQLQPEARVIEYLLPRIDRDYAAMGRLVGAIDKAALARQRAVTVPLVADVLAAQADTH